MNGSPIKHFLVLTLYCLANGGFIIAIGRGNDQQKLAGSKSDERMSYFYQHVKSPPTDRIELFDKKPKSALLFFSSLSNLSKYSSLPFHSGTAIRTILSYCRMNE